jgi:CheY-like chemotaxis protein
MADKWNFLVYDDDPEVIELLLETFQEEGFLGEDSVICTTVDNFSEAAELVRTGNFDLVVLDLQDEESDSRAGQGEILSGEKILALLKSCQFTPVVFHTGYAEKIRHLESPFVKVVSKGDAQLGDVVRNAFSTKLPSLIRYIQEQQRVYLWDHVETHWKGTDELKENGEVAYLLARRLSTALSPASIRRFFDAEGDAGSTVHPVEYYIWPSLEGGVYLGDIYLNNADGGYHLVINPACDLEQCKTDFVLFVRCRPIGEFPEFSEVEALVKSKKEVGTGKKKELQALIADNRKVSGGQPERFKYIPGTSFIPHLVADFQLLSQVSIKHLISSGEFTRVATLDSPFAEGVQAKFARYYGRFGVPDLKFDQVTQSLVSGIG